MCNPKGASFLKAVLGSKVAPSRLSIRLNTLIYGAKYFISLNCKEEMKYKRCKVGYALTVVLSVCAEVPLRKTMNLQFLPMGKAIHGSSVTTAVSM